MGEEKEIMIENCLVLCQNPVLEGFSNRISKEDSEYYVCSEDELSLDFSKAHSLENVKEILETLCKHDVHIMGSRGYIYHTGKLAKVLDTFGGFDVVLFPRAFGLRAKVFEIITQ